MSTSEFASAGLTAGQLNAIVKKLGGHEMALRFLRDELVVSEPVSWLIHIDRTKSFNPAEFISEGWTIEEQDARSLALTEVDLTKVRFETMLRSDESYVGGEEKLKRLKKAGHICLDAEVFQVLWNDQSLIPESWKEKVGSNTRFIYFDGTILRRPGGDRYVLYLCWDDGRWGWGCRWLGGDWDFRDPSAVLAS